LALDWYFLTFRNNDQDLLMVGVSFGFTVNR